MGSASSTRKKNKKKKELEKQNSKKELSVSVASETSAGHDVSNGCEADASPRDSARVPDNAKSIENPSRVVGQDLDKASQREAADNGSRPVSHGSPKPSAPSTPLSLPPVSPNGRSVTSVNAAEDEDEMSEMSAEVNGDNEVAVEGVGGEDKERVTKGEPKRLNDSYEVTRPMDTPQASRGTVTLNELSPMGSNISLSSVHSIPERHSHDDSDGAVIETADSPLATRATDIESQHADTPVAMDLDDTDRPSPDKDIEPTEGKDMARTQADLAMAESSKPDSPMAVSGQGGETDPDAHGVQESGDASGRDLREKWKSKWKQDRNVAQDNANTRIREQREFEAQFEDTPELPDTESDTGINTSRAAVGDGVTGAPPTATNQTGAIPDEALGDGEDPQDLLERLREIKRQKEERAAKERSLKLELSRLRAVERIIQEKQQPAGSAKRRKKKGTPGANKTRPINTNGAS